MLSAGPTPNVVPEGWRLEVWPADGGAAVGWSWEEFRRLPSERVTADIHCVTRWSKLDTSWEGVSLDTLLTGMPPATFLGAYCYGGYTTNLPLADVTGGKAWAVWSYDGQPLTAEQGGPGPAAGAAPVLLEEREVASRSAAARRGPAGFWEQAGYHNHVDLWAEQRYSGD